MDARAQTLVHVSLEMTRQERDEMTAWFKAAEESMTQSAPVIVKMLWSVLSATETSTGLPVSDFKEPT